MAYTRVIEITDIRRLSEIVENEVSELQRRGYRILGIRVDVTTRIPIPEPIKNMIISRLLEEGAEPVYVNVYQMSFVTTLKKLATIASIIASLLLAYIIVKITVTIIYDVEKATTSIERITSSPALTLLLIFALIAIIMWRR